MNTLSYSIHALILALAFAVSSSPNSIAAAQDQVQALEPESQESIPEHAVWRFGEYGHATDSNGIYRLEYSPDGKLLATRNRENTVAIYDLKTRKQVCEVSGHENNWVETIDFSPDSRFFATAAGSGEKIKIWNAATGKLESEIDTDGIAAYFDESGKSIHVLGESHVETYSWPGVQRATQRKWKTDNLTRVGMSRDGRLVIAFRTLRAQVYQTLVVDLDTKSKMTLDGSTSIPKSVVVSANNLWVAVAHRRDSKVWLWDLRDPGQKKYSLAKHDETVQSISISPDNRFLISSGWDEKVVAWDMLTRQPIGQFKGHSEHVNATACSPLDHTFASGASGVDDCSTIIWNMSEHLFPDVAEPKGEDFESIWRGLGTESLGNSLRATSSLVRGGELFLEPLFQRIKSQVTDTSSGTFEENIQRLTHPEFAVREQATEELIRVRGQADNRLRRELAESHSPELRYRIGRILKTEIARPASSLIEIRRWGRIILALEQISSNRARQILEAIAGGHRNVDIAQDARDSLVRIELRAKLVP